MMRRPAKGNAAKPRYEFNRKAVAEALLALSMAAITAFHGKAFAGQSPKAQNPPITVRFTDVRQAAGITFLQDSTQTEEKYYLETMGTGVGWLDYDQDGLMDL